MNTKVRKKSKAMKALEKVAGEKLSLGALLLSIRQGEGLSQVAFAQSLGVSRQYLCDIEHQRRFVSPKVAVSFAVTLGYCPEQFIRLYLQDMIDREGIHMTVSVKAA